jgi:hypothetical protein
MIKCGGDSRTQVGSGWILAKPKPLHILISTVPKIKKGARRRKRHVDASKKSRTVYINDTKASNTFVHVLQAVKEKSVTVNCQAEQLGINHVIVEYLSRKAAYMRSAG